MNRGEYAPVPLDIEADIEAFQIEYQSSSQPINQSNSRFIKTVTFIVSLLALSWLVGIGVVLYRSPIDQSIHSNAPNKLSFSFYSLSNHSSTGQLFKSSTESSTSSVAIQPVNSLTSQQTFSESIDQSAIRSSSTASATSSAYHSTSEPVAQSAHQSAHQKISNASSSTTTKSSTIEPTKPSISRVPYPAYMKPGSLAPAGFNFKGKCGVDGYKCVVSFGLYGTRDKYVKGAIENARLMPQVYDGWTMRVYHDSSVPSDALSTLRELNVELVEADKSINGTTAGMFWRFLVAADSSVDRYIIRDTDSRLNHRERAAIDEWLASGYSMHTMRDHPTGHSLPMNGGLWAGSKGVLSNIGQLIDKWSHNTIGADQNLLNMEIYPVIKFDHLAHDAYTCPNYLNSIGFPTQRQPDFQHIGQVFFDDGNINQDALDEFVKGKIAPKKCRRNSEWIYG